MRVHVEPSPTPLDLASWRAQVRATVSAGLRPLTLYGQRQDGDVLLTAVLQAPSGDLRTLRARLAPDEPYEDPLDPADLSLQGFAREVHEQFGVPMPGHPWLKPVRFEGGGGQAAMDSYPWYTITGKDVHEVAVGPIHAGVIEPGSFRFLCHGERVLHLEIQLGYQHRGVETLLLRTPHAKLLPLVETISGDTSVGHAWAASLLVEALGGTRGVAPSAATGRSRAVLLELERIGMHLVGLSGVAADVGHLQGASTYGRLRTTAINATMRLCGGRFGRTGVRPGAPAYTLDAAGRTALGAAVDLLETDLAAIDDRFLTDPTVRHRLVDVGTVDTAVASRIGMVGIAGRASGVTVDQRAHAAPGLYDGFVAQVERTGDCMARVRVRVRELHQSLARLRAVLADEPEWVRARVPTAPLAPGQLAIAVVEGWRGEVVHAAETDGEGRLTRYKVQDPSFRNWLGLALAVRGQQISDFPVCNKSFDLSYCGHDL